MLYRILLFSVKPQHESAIGIHTLHPFARCLCGPGSSSSMSDSLEADEPSDLGFMCSPFYTAPLPVAAHPVLASSHLSHFLTHLTCTVPFLLQGLPLALSPLWGAGSPHPLSPSSLPSLWPQYVPGSSQQASPLVLAARCRLLRFLTLWPVGQRWTSPQPPSLSCPRRLT